MRSRTANWFECKIRYEKVMEDGLQKKVTESYVVDALSFSEAEKRIIEEMSSYISGEFDVADIKKAAYKEIFFSGRQKKRSAPALPISVRQARLMVLLRTSKR